MPRGNHHQAGMGFLNDLAELDDELVAAAEEAQPPDADPPAKPAAQPASFDVQPLTSRLDEMNALMRQQAAERQQRDNRSGQPEEKSYARTRAVYDDEFYGKMDSIDRRQKELDDRLAAAEQRDRETLRADMNREDRSQQMAVENLRRKYKNFDSHVPAELQTKALQIAKSGRQFGQDWESELEAYYWRKEGPARHAADNDEVNKKREQKTAQKPTQVPRGGGAGFQQPQVEVAKGRDKGYRRARGGFIADLNAHFGG